MAKNNSLNTNAIIQLIDKRSSIEKQFNAGQKARAFDGIKANYKAARIAKHYDTLLFYEQMLFEFYSIDSANPKKAETHRKRYINLIEKKKIRIELISVYSCLKRKPKTRNSDQLQKIINKSLMQFEANSL